MRPQEVRCIDDKIGQLFGRSRECLSLCYSLSGGYLSPVLVTCHLCFIKKCVLCCCMELASANNETEEVGW